MQVTKTQDWPFLRSGTQGIQKGYQETPQKFLRHPRRCKIEFQAQSVFSTFGRNRSKCHFWPKKRVSLNAWLQILTNGQKWCFKAITAKSEENILSLKFNFTSSRVSQNFQGVSQYPIYVPHVPDLKKGQSYVLVTCISKGLTFPRHPVMEFSRP